MAAVVTQSCVQSCQPARGRKLVAAGLRIVQRSAAICDALPCMFPWGSGPKVNGSKFNVPLGVLAQGFCLIT
jgi:hypothetical protein